MPDGSTFTREQVSKTSVISIGLSDPFNPVAAQAVTLGEWQTYQRLDKALKGAWRRGKKLAGAADFTALRAAGVLNLNVRACFDGDNTTWFIRRGSVRFWWLVGHYEGDWARARGGRRLPHEVAAERMCDAARALSNSKDSMKPGSRWWRTFNVELKRHEAVAAFDAMPRDERHVLVLKAWLDSRLALRDFFAAVERYAGLRAKHDSRSIERACKEASQLLDLGASPSVDIMRRKYKAAWRAYCEALNARELEERRVKALYPTCPVRKIIGGTDEDPLTTAADAEDVENWRERGDISPEEAISDLAALKRWRTNCRLIDQLHLDRSLERVEKMADARYCALEELLIAAPTPTRADVLAKLRFIDADMFDGHYPRAKQAVIGLINDLSKPLVGQQVATDLSELYAAQKAAADELGRAETALDEAEGTPAEAEAERLRDIASDDLCAAQKRFECAPVRSLADMALKLQYATVDMRGVDLSHIVGNFRQSLEAAV